MKVRRPRRDRRVFRRTTMVTFRQILLRTPPAPPWLPGSLRSGPPQDIDDAREKPHRRPVAEAVQDAQAERPIPQFVQQNPPNRRTYRCIRRQRNANKADDDDRNRPFPPGRLLLTVSANGKSDRPDDHRTRSNPHGNKVLPQVHVHQFPAAPAAGRSVPAAIAAAINTNRSWCQVHDSVPLVPPLHFGSLNSCYVDLSGIPCNGTGFHVVTRPGTPLPPDGRYGRFFMPVVLHRFAAAVGDNRQNGS